MWWRRLALLLLSLFGLLGESALARGAVETVVQARFQPLPTLRAPADAAAEAWQPVALPHHWPGVRQGRQPAGVYRLRFERPAEAGLMALRFSGASERAVLRLNGQLLHEIGDQLAPRHVYRAMPLLVTIPPALLRPGVNEIELLVEHGGFSRARLTPMVVGPHAALADQHAQRLRWQVEVPQHINLLAMVIGALMVLVWLRRRQEVAMALLGVVYLVGSCRNYGYYSDLILPAAAWDAFQFVSVTCTASLSLLFALHHTAVSPTAVPWPRFRRALVRVVAGLSMLGVLAAMVDPTWLMPLRLLSYPASLPMGACVVWLLARHARRTGTWVDAWMALAYAVLLLSTLVDLMLLFGLWQGFGSFTLPFTMPVLLAVFSLVLLDRVLHAMRTAEDLTHTLERRVADRTLALQQASDAKARFLAAASHDLRQPLSAIGLRVGLLRERLGRPDAPALVDQVQAGVDGLAALLKGMLDLSRLEGGQWRLRVEAVPLQPLLRALEVSSAPLARVQGIRLRVVPTRAVVRTDPVLLDSMLRNLVSNAIRYTPAGGVLVGVRRRAGGLAELQVIDTGVGIDAAEQQRVFEEFYRGQAAEGRESGFGLGLAIVRRAADLLGHRIDLRSAPGRGTTIGLSMPLAAEAGTAGSGVVEHGIEPEDRRALAGAFIALVEDDEALRDALAELLRQWGCHVAVAGSLSGLQQALKAHLREPDLLLADHRLNGDGDGLDAVEQLRQALVAPGLPALLLTADSTHAMLERARLLAVPVLHKPATPAQLAEALAALLRSRP